MIDVKLLRKDPEMIRRLCERRGSGVDIDRLLSVDEQVRKMQTELNELQRERNKLAGPEARERGAELKSRISDVEPVIRELSEERDALLGWLPNLLADDTPPGDGDEDNEELTAWGCVPEFDFEPCPHEVIGERLDVLDLKAGTRVAGSGFYFWKGVGAQMVWAMFTLANEFLTRRGFVPMFTPIVARTQTLFGTGYLPFFADEIYQLEGEDLSVIGTSEQTLVGYHAEQMLANKSLPLLYSAFTPCMRTEAGSYGKASRGAFRVHQFHKVEQIVFCRPEQSERWHEECLVHETEFMQLLDIPYRVVRVCLGDLGAPAYKKYDVEAYFAGYGSYRETHSNTNLLDYQTRRLNIRYKEGKQTVFPHTISATMITDRAALAILENNQRSDGSVVIPEALRPYMNDRKLIEPR